ncbi:hypothetical protein TNCV_2849191 [Trichonephila clavipes]|nr:hypothetical protein TNCV_2849191 [Trichonephila clavipes]
MIICSSPIASATDDVLIDRPPSMLADDSAQTASAHENDVYALFMKHSALNESIATVNVIKHTLERPWRHARNHRHLIVVSYWHVIPCRDH